LHDALPIWCRSSASWFWWWSYWVCSVLELGACSSVPVDSSRSGEQAFCGGPGGPPACPATRQGRQRQHPDQGVDQAVVAADVSVVRVRLPNGDPFLVVVVTDRDQRAGSPGTGRIRVCGGRR